MQRGGQAMGEKQAILRRREFLKTGTISLLAQRLLNAPARGQSPVAGNASGPGALPSRILGRTGQPVSILSLGGQGALDEPNNEERAIPVIERALDLGVNYIDTAADYGGDQRWSERNIGQVMKRRRTQVFLASKTHERTRDGSLRLLEQSLRFLETHYLDLWQIHNLKTMDELERVFAPGGAMEALQEAHRQKMVRFFGVTGHFDPYILVEAVRRFPFDAILMSLNAADRHHLSFIDHLLPLAVKQQTGIIAMKVAGNARIIFRWKDALRLRRPGTLTMQEAMHYVLSLPVSTVNVGCGSVEEVEENAQIARNFSPLSNQQMQELEAKTHPIARQALYFRNWA
jgi:aryl-alcohol dehydrogenase-like predicted oxidoreductase